MGETPSLFDALREKRHFIPGGFRDEDGVWHDGPHQIEFDNALNKAEMAFRDIVEFPEYPDMSPSWHFAEVRQIARRALGRA